MRLDRPPNWMDLDEDDDDLMEVDDCSWCGGDGYVECDDRIQCTRRHLKSRHPDTGQELWEEECHACGGTGLAKDQTAW